MFKNILKHSSIVAIVIVALVTSVLVGCQKDSSEDNIFNLVAPNGERIASSISNLEKELIPLIENNISISEIEYIPVTDGYSVLISYLLPDGTTGNIVKIHKSQVRLKNGNENSGGTKEYKKCEGSCDCQIQVETSTTQEPQFSCTCLPCTVVTITQ
ncbi:MAG: hypothetical protein LBL57_05120 [Tannerella sp.]|jgi:hypothetical protein|nr:hypothetical protein [Tannerella sp.]